MRGGDPIRLMKKAQPAPGCGFLMLETKFLRLVRSKRILRALRRSLSAIHWGCF